MPKLASKSVLSLTLIVLTCISTILLSSPALAWWNTGLVTVQNQSARRIRVVPKHGGSYPDFEFNSSIAAFSKEDFDGEIISWCDNTYELKNKGWRIDYEVAPELFVPVARICQNYRDDTIYLVQEGSSWDQRVRCAVKPYSYIDLTIRADGTVFCSG